MTLKKSKSKVFYLKEGSIATALSWIVMSIFGALPLWLTGEISSYVDALFETVSGFTTTGATILNDVESLSYTSLMWRCFTHWIGGMGVLVFLLAIVPLSGASNINLMRAESPGPSVEKLVPKIKSSARILYLIYFIMTLVEAILLLLGKMPLFDAIATAFGTAGTGGFGVKNDSLAGYSPYIQWIVTIFMLLFAVNFNVYYLALFGKFKKILSMQEVKCFFGIIIAATAIIFANILDSIGNVADAIRTAAFQVASIMSSTGFATADFNQWSKTAQTILVFTMFIGACAGSTGGGIKVSRIIIAVKTVGKELNSYIHPKSIKKIKMDGKPIDHDVVRATNVYLITYALIFAVSFFLISFENKNLVTNFTAIAATINNTGPGLELVGPTANFAHFSDLSKFIIIFDMLAGRLELFPLLILFHPAIYKDVFYNIKSALLKKTK